MTGLVFLANIVKDTNIGFVKIFKKGENEEAEELSLAGFSGAELGWFYGVELQSWFRIGEYWYAVV